MLTRDLRRPRGASGIARSGAGIVYLAEELYDSLLLLRRYLPAGQGHIVVPLVAHPHLRGGESNPNLDYS